MLLRFRQALESVACISFLPCVHRLLRFAILLPLPFVLAAADHPAHWCPTLQCLAASGARSRRQRPAAAMQTGGRAPLLWSMPCALT